MSSDAIHDAPIHPTRPLLKQLEEEVVHRNKNTDPELIAENARKAKIPPWMVRAHAAQEVMELHENLNQLRGLELTDSVSRSVALYYEEDPTVAGMVIAALSCFPGEPSIYYASIVRYTAANGAGKIVVAGCKAPGLEAAIRGSAKAWLDGLQAERRQRIQGEDLEDLLTKSLEDRQELVLDREKFLEKFPEGCGDGTRVKG